MWIFYLGFTAFVYLWYWERDLFNIDFNALARFLAFMFAYFCLMLGMSQLKYHPSNIPPTTDFLSMLFVFVEDALFVGPFFILRKYTTNKYIYLAYWIISSLAFGFAHTYKPLVWQLVTAIYPFFISYKFSKKYGLGTVMLGHIFYDFILSISAKLIPLILM